MRQGLFEKEQWPINNHNYFDVNGISLTLSRSDFVDETLPNVSNSNILPELYTSGAIDLELRQVGAAASGMGTTLSSINQLLEDDHENLDVAHDPFSSRPLETAPVLLAINMDRVSFPPVRATITALDDHDGLISETVPTAKRYEISSSHNIDALGRGEFSDQS